MKSDRRAKNYLYQRFTDRHWAHDRLSLASFNCPAEQNEMYLHFTAAGTRTNQLFLTESVERNVTYFEDVYDWFDTSLVLIFPFTVSPGAELGAIYMNDVDNFQTKYRDLIQLFDLGIDDIELNRLDRDAAQLLTEQDKSNISSLISKLPDHPEATAILYDSAAQGLHVVVDKYAHYEGYHFVTIHNVKHEDRRTCTLSLTMESDAAR